MIKVSVLLADGFEEIEALTAVALPPVVFPFDGQGFM